jgi:hypothetical protein
MTWRQHLPGPSAWLYVRRPAEKQMLTIRVLDEDMFESDDLLGRGLHSLTSQLNLSRF